MFHICPISPTPQREARSSYFKGPEVGWKKSDRLLLSYGAIALHLQKFSK
ncbi:hypothetical protein [Okeania sp. SIO2B3]|nr:hypothetical protein [Okeania sp. SIO2B3]NET42483.1 hypothetical protein [Okeania sp. SIO2B3]